MSNFANPPCDEGIVLSSPVVAGYRVTARNWVLCATILASSMAFIDGTVVNVALPALQRNLDASISDAQWIVESYALLLAALLLVGGASGDRFGLRRVFTLGVVLFAAASVWCALAGGVRELIAARSVQGVGAALLVPTSLAIISATFDERTRGAAFGTWAGATAITTALGPLLGGWLIDHLSWRAVFYINVPLAAAVLGLTIWRMPEFTKAEAHATLDWSGAILVTLGLAGLVYALIEAPVKGWSSAPIIVAFGVGIFALGAFVAVEARGRSPMVPLRLFRSCTFTGANLLTFLLYAGLGGGLFFLPLDLIQVQGYSSTEAGAAMLPFILLMFTFSRWSGGLVDRYGARLPLILGPSVAAIGFALFAVPTTGAGYWTAFFPAVVVLGFGMSLSAAPLTTTIMNAVDAPYSGVASGINNAAARVAGLLAVAAFGVVLTAVFDYHLDARLPQLKTNSVLLKAVNEQRQKLAAIALPANVPESERAAARRAIDDSFVSGFRWVMMISALLAVASAASAWLLIRDVARSPRIDVT